MNGCFLGRSEYRFRLVDRTLIVVKGIEELLLVGRELVDFSRQGLR